MASDPIKIECSEQPIDFCFHPTKPHILVAGLIDGTVEVHDVSSCLPSIKVASTSTRCDSDSENEEDTILSSTPVHFQPSANKDGEVKLASCRGVVWADDCIYTAGSEGDIVCLDGIAEFSSEPLPILWRSSDSSISGHAPIHTFVSFVRDGRTFLATGDEAGWVKIWDPRAYQEPVRKWRSHDDYISGITTAQDGNVVISSSADCTISVCDLRLNEKPKRSDDQEDELLSIQVMKNGRKIVCGTGEGVLAVWSWGTYGDVSDRFPGHPESIDALLKVDEEVLLTGSSDGLLRVVQVQPDKFLGVLGDHDGFPIEQLKFNADRSFVGSTSHDQYIRLFDASILKDEYNGDVEEVDMDAEEAARKHDSELKDCSDDEWDDMDEDSDEEEEDSKPKAKNLKTDNERFFEDL